MYVYVWEGKENGGVKSHLQMQNQPLLANPPTKTHYVVYVAPMLLTSPKLPHNVTEKYALDCCISVSNGNQSSSDCRFGGEERGKKKNKRDGEMRNGQ